MSANPFADMETQAANQYGVNPSWFQALTTVESSQNPNAVSSAGAIGLGQLLPSTAAGLGITNPQDLYNPQINLSGSANYFSQMVRLAGGDYHTAVEYYNCGPGNTCAAGQAEADAVTKQFVSNAIGGPNSNNPNTSQPYQALTNSTSTGIAAWVGGFASRAGIIAVGALLVIFAVVIPNRDTILKIAPK